MNVDDLARTPTYVKNMKLRKRVESLKISVELLTHLYVSRRTNCLMNHGATSLHRSVANFINHYKRGILPAVNWLNAALLSSRDKASQRALDRLI